MSSLVLATAGYDHTIRFWEATTGICWRTIPHNDSHVNKLEISQDKRWLAAAGNPSVKVYDIQSNTNSPYYTFTGHSGNVSAIGFNKEGRWLYSGELLVRPLSTDVASTAGSEDRTVKIWDTRTRDAQREFESRAPVTTVTLVQGQNELISGDQDGNIRVWDITAGACSCELVPEVDVAVRSVSVALDGSQVVAANNSGICFVWSMLRTGTAGGKQSTNFEPLHRLKAHDSYILKCLISPDVRKLATTSSDKSIKIWSLYNYQLEQELVGHNKWVWDAVFSVDAAYLVTASSDHTARLWDVEKGMDIRVYVGHTKAVVCCALNDNAMDGTAH